MAAGTNGQLVVGQTSVAPSWQTVSGDATLAASGALTVAANSISNSKAAQMAGYTLKGNTAAGLSNSVDFQISGLAQKVTPAGTDLLLISDEAASHALKYATVSSIGSATVVSSIDAKTGAFTTGNGLDSTGGNIIELTPARRTLPTAQAFSTGSGTYTTPANTLWIRIR